MHPTSLCLQPTFAAMAGGKKYFDSDGDFRCCLQLSDLGEVGTMKKTLSAPAANGKLLT
jgi:hypothetical protein